MSVTGRVLAEVGSGATTAAEVATRTGLDRELVALALDRLAASGRLEVQSPASGCPPTGCGGCRSGADGAPGCAGPTPRHGPLLLSLGRRRS